MRPPEIIQKLFPFIILSMVLAVVFVTNMEAEASSMLPDTDRFNGLSQISPLPTPESTNEPTAVPTSKPTDEPTPKPTDVPSSPTFTPIPSDRNVSLVFDGPSSVKPNESFSVSVIAQNVPDPGLYGVQFDINYDSSKVLVNNLALNPNLSFVVWDTIDNTSGSILIAASKQGRVPGLTGDVVLLTFNATMIGDSGFTIFDIENVKFSDSQASAFDVTVNKYKIVIDQEATPVPTSKPTDEPTPKPTEPPVDPTPKPTIEPTPKPTDVPTSEPPMAAVSGQIILAGRAGNNWSGAIAKINSVEQTATTSTNGNFEFAEVPAGLHTISVDAPGYLSAECSEVTITAPQIVLSTVSLLAGDINDDNVVDIVDAAIVGTSFGETGPNIPADITQDKIVDIFDLVLVGVNYEEEGPQTWNCTSPNGSPIK